MARSPSSLNGCAHQAGQTAGRRGITAAVAALLLLGAACSRQSEPEPAQFVGRWKSSRIATMPLHMRANGEWEIEPGDGAPLQYGVWQVQGRRMLWTVRMGGRTTHDENAIIAVGPQRFELREQDGSITRFDRID